MDRKSVLKRVWIWLDDRLGLSALRYPVPAHANTIWYTLGGVTFVGIAVLAITGVWLAQYYNPTPEEARRSVLYIENTVPLGHVIRQVHVWLAYLVVIAGSLHLARVFVTASYKVPREINWLVGLALLVLLLFGSVFTGTVLPWDQEGYEAMTHNMELAVAVGGVGGFFSEGFTASVSMLTRLHVAHVSIVPVLLVLLLIAHFFLIKHHGISPTPKEADGGEAPGGRLPPEKETARYSTHLELMLGYGLVLVALAVVFGAVFPQPVGPEPDPTIEVTKPPFVFYWLYPFENWFGVRGLSYGAAIVFGLLALVPFVDRTPLRHLHCRPAAIALGTVLLLIILTLSMVTAIEPPARHLGEAQRQSNHAQKDGLGTATGYAIESGSKSLLAWTDHKDSIMNC